MSQHAGLYQRPVGSLEKRSAVVRDKKATEASVGLLHCSDSQLNTRLPSAIYAYIRFPNENIIM